MFIVAQMRTRCRLGLEGAGGGKGGKGFGGKGGKGGDGLGNVPVGTVVDEGITSGDNDWYMVPHHGLQGTARPSHYHVLEDDAKLSLDVRAGADPPARPRAAPCHG